MHSNVVQWALIDVVDVATLASIFQPRQAVTRKIGNPIILNTQSDKQAHTKKNPPVIHSNSALIIGFCLHIHTRDVGLWSGESRSPRWGISREGN